MTNQLVYSSKNHDELVTNTVIVSKQFDKNHRDVMRNARKIAAQNCAAEKMFVESTYIDNNNHEQPMIIMNRDGFSLLAMGFTGKKAIEFKLDFINQFNEMEKQIQSPFGKFASMIPTNMTEALQLALDQQKQLEKQKPKVDYYDEAMDNPALITVTEIALHYGLSARKLNEFLESKGVIYKKGNVWVLRQKYKGKGYADYKPFNDVKNGHRVASNLLKWTQRGAKFIHDLLEANGIIGTLKQMDLALELNTIRKDKEQWLK